MKHYLSIIIPCYNSKRTLEEALKSVYEQHLSIPFEVILFDDGSTDGTKDLIRALQKKYKHIRTGSHTINKGGGATRNDAVVISKGDLIFPLDSDDILPPNVLSKMIAYLDLKKCDGVVFEESKFFRNTITKTNSVKNSILNKNIKLRNLLDGNNGFLTQVNFLYRKKSFIKAKGYPEHYDFDTQGYGYRFLAQGLKVFVCPYTFYYHRQGAQGKSYYERMYESGLLSINIYYLFEDVKQIFSTKVIGDILQFNIFIHNDTKYNLMFVLKKLGVYNQYAKKVKHIIPIKYIKQFILAIHFMQEYKWTKAKEELLSLQDVCGSLPVLQWNLTRSNVGIQSRLKRQPLLSEILQVLPKGLITKRQSLIERSFFKRCINLCMNKLFV